MTLRKLLKNVNIQNAEQLEAVEEEVENAEVVIATLNGLPGSWIHSCKECVPEGSNYFRQTLGRRRSSSHKKRRRKMEAIEDQALTIQRRSLKRWGIRRTQRTSYSSYHLDKKWWFHEWRRWWSRMIKKESTHETSKQKISIQLSFNDIVLLCIWLYSVDVLCMIDCLH